ncbi:response regulator transcription factor [Micromonospora sp. R77]|uniref:response regulator transcription factor n=1 Tax=Micromonospora sp. R77 TaxID=2925836 RepID=UPI001F611DEE|nr:response regulator transcription factor [Micromonospora sp. R77]MCI4061428.1 response regulator transcription factor [Micromonospora sp. R77]
MAKVLLIDDDARCRARTSRQLTRLGHAVASLDTEAVGAAASALLRRGTRRPDVVVIDPFVSDMHALPMVQMVCATARRPVLVMTAPRPDHEIARILVAGADDYVGKPASPLVLDARIGAILRRRPVEEEADQLMVGQLRLDSASREVSVAGRALCLTRTEFDLIARLAEAPGRYVPRARLAELLSPDGSLSVGALNTLLSRLRAKLGESARQPRYLHSSRSRGIALMDAERG